MRRAAARLEGLSRRLGATSSPAEHEQPPGLPRYAWAPATEADARAEILLTPDEDEFDASGRHELGRLLPFVDETTTALDLGCGIGRIARHLAPHCRALWAVDASPRMLELAGGRLAGVANIRYALCKDTAVPDIADASVDFVYSVLVLQHLEKEDAFLLLEEMYRVLRPGGRALYTWPNLDDDGYLRAFVQGARAGEATNLYRARPYTVGELQRLIPAAGYSSVELHEAPNIVTVCTR
ncbi:MAG TPA: class I SAM-dependent methyltransferase [Acidimicrobiales bacterium]|nr:class I SAM-dependent methyltransferase [Acidimicrobiales bacterium]